MVAEFLHVALVMNLPAENQAYIDLPLEIFYGKL